MGVKQLWKLLAPYGRYISIETLGTQRLAVDVSIWLEQFARAMIDSRGQPIPNGHIIGVLRRICKLLYHNIKPVFVFDGVPPEAKNVTLEKRHAAKEKIYTRLEELKQKVPDNEIEEKEINTEIKPTESEILDP